MEFMYQYFKRFMDIILALVLIIICAIPMVIIAIAIKLADQLFPYGIDLRVVTMPSMELFDHQNDRYKSMLLPRELKIFSLEYGTKNLWNKYVTNSDYIFGLDDYPSTGTKNELLNSYNLDMDSLMTKIIETFKN